MTLETHLVNDLKIAEVISAELVVTSSKDGFDLMVNLYYQEFDGIILHVKNIAPDFFDLKNGMAGELLQKFSNYRIRLSVVGDFSDHQSRSVQDFISESNRLGQISFVGSTALALKALAGS